MAAHVDPIANIPIPPSPIDALFAGQLPENHDPLADGILMLHQIEWIEDKSDLKLCRKGRRTGITYAEALDDTLIAASARSAGGDNIWYIGDTKDKGREFINTCAHFARVVAKELLAIDEFMFEDVNEDGEPTGRMITAWAITFSSGFRICALSSRPANIRGLQGIVVIDEAAFHPNVSGVIDACNALIIWGGKIRIISTHNGVKNPFNTLIKDTEAGDFDYSIHTVPFDTAVVNGLYERVCLIKGWKPSPGGKESWYRKVRRTYGNRTEAMREELDAIPREGEGVAIPLAWIEKCSTKDYRVERWRQPAEDFVDWPEEARRASMREWIDEHVDPYLGDNFFPRGLATAIGGDFALRQDRASYPVGYTAQDLTRHVPLICELVAPCPYDQQKQLLFHLGNTLIGRGRFQGMVLDANGNGMVLAQEARQKFGPELVVELMPNDAWLRENFPPFRAAFEDGTFEIPADLDTRDDVRAFQTVNGVSKIPSNIRSAGTDGGKRHGDNGVGLLNFYAATRREIEQYGYRRAVPGRRPAARRVSATHGIRSIKGLW